MITVFAPWAVPVVPDADQARDAARRELADPGYRSQEPTLFERAAEEVLKALGELFDSAAGAAPGGWWSLVVLTAVVIGGLLAVRARVGALARTHRGAGEVFADVVRSAAEHHTQADAAVAAGDLDTAVRERFRALVRGLEERGLLDPRPGRTADEAAGEAAGLLVGCGDELRGAARVFDDVRYGGRAGSREGHDTVAAADAAARRARPGSTPVSAGAGWVTP